MAGKDTPNPFMGVAFPKSLLVQLTQQVAEILKKDMYKEVESKSSRSVEGPSKEDKDVRSKKRFSIRFDKGMKTRFDMGGRR